MSFLGLRKWPIVKPLWPFFIASGVTYWLVSKAQDKMIRAPEYAHDPRNPYAAQIAKEAHH
ncbi:hypothetical protein CERSUDRAFT_48950 [Gelatoporia subvermispora B]|uniref:Uncharacterized protein n=1 Tax=Ceriporiopsis subvermispora (strain B) TaxID=914234 RepID=M2PNM2_CERS8|nr:hypothetical protein CERSUDRAFT_48950 [Gelatoporia subvermispora B]